VRKQMAAMIAVMNGVDLVIFTGGIGENDAEVRATICEGLSWIGVSLDLVRNQSASDTINSATSRCSVRVLASLEDERIARHTWTITTAATER
jgi:acetate kinase